MQTKFIPLASGLALAATLSLVAAVGPDDESASSDSAAPAATTTTTTPDDADSIVAQSATTAITLPLVGEVTVVEPETSEADEALEAYLAGVEQAELEAYLAGVEQAKLDEYLAGIAEAEAAAAAAAAPAPSYATGSVEEIIARYFGSQTQKALSVARCESGLNPGAMSPGGGNHGLFQINNVHSGNWVSVTGTDWSNRYNAELNTKFAHWLWSNQGWGPWACA